MRRTKTQNSGIFPFLVLLLFATQLCLYVVFYPFHLFPKILEQNPRNQLNGLFELVKRRVPLEDILRIQFKLIEPALPEHFSWEVFESFVRIEGTSLSSLSLGLGSFYRKFCSIELLSWADFSRPNKSCFALFNSSLVSDRRSTVFAQVPFRYAWNAVTFSYSSTFWTWNRYERELDWLALRGVNLLLAHEGQEFLFRKVFLELCGIDPMDSYFTHEVYFAWNRMGNIHNHVSHPPSVDYIVARNKLQHLILGRMQDLGIRPVLPSFNGFVPQGCGSVVGVKYWSGFSAADSSVPRLHPRDPLFRSLSSRVISIQLEEYAPYLVDAQSDCIYFSLDIFNENPVQEKEDLEALAHAVVSEPHRVSAQFGYTRLQFVMQMWFLANDAQYWTVSKSKLFFRSFPPHSLILLDLHAEKRSQFHRLGLNLDRSFSQSVIYCVLHNFGGGGGLGGELQRIQQDSRQGFVGIGFAPEGLEQNELVYDFTLHLAWSLPFSMVNWSRARYREAKLPLHVLHTWQHVFSTVYSRDEDHAGWGTSKSIWEVRPYPFFSIHGNFMPTTVNHKLNLFFRHRLKGWTNGLVSPALLYDQIDFSRQLLSDMCLLVVDRLEQYVLMRSETGFQHAKRVLFDLFRLVNRVLTLHPRFCFQSQPADYISLSPLQKQLRKELLTIWNSRNDGSLADYGSQQLGGSLFLRVHQPRWEIVLNGSVHSFAEARGWQLADEFLVVEKSWIHEDEVKDLCEFTGNADVVLNQIFDLVALILSDRQII